MEQQMETNKNIAAAFVAAQAEMRNPKFDSVNPHFRNKYASLAAIYEAVRPVLNKHGITIAQDITTVAGGIACSTVLTHTSGEQMKFGPLVLPVTKADAQGFVSAATYAKRCTAASVCGVVGEEDDDGETAVNRGASAPTPQPIFKKAVPAPTDNAKAAAALAVKMEKDNVHADLVRAFLDSKNSWPKDCERVGALPTNILTRLCDPKVWEEVKNFVPPPQELNP